MVNLIARACTLVASQMLSEVKTICRVKYRKKKKKNNKNKKATDGETKFPFL